MRSIGTWGGGRINVDLRVGYRERWVILVSAVQWFLFVVQTEPISSFAAFNKSNRLYVAAMPFLHPLDQPLVGHEPGLHCSRPSPPTPTTAFCRSQLLGVYLNDIFNWVCTRSVQMGKTIHPNYPILVSLCFTHLLPMPCSPRDRYCRSTKPTGTPRCHTWHVDSARIGPSCVHTELWLALIGIN